jgi:hypothetical protein
MFQVWILNLRPETRSSADGWLSKNRVFRSLLEEKTPRSCRRGHGDHVIRINLNRSGLLNEMHRNHETTLTGLPHQHPVNSLQRPSRHFDRHALVKKRMGIEGQGTVHEPLQRVNFTVRDRLRLAARPHNSHHSRRRQNRTTIFPQETGETVPREQRERNLFFSVFPMAHPRNEREKILDTQTNEPFSNLFLMP